MMTLTSFILTAVVVALVLSIGYLAYDAARIKPINLSDREKWKAEALRRREELLAKMKEEHDEISKLTDEKIRHLYAGFSSKIDDALNEIERLKAEWDAKYLDEKIEEVKPTPEINAARAKRIVKKPAEQPKAAVVKSARTPRKRPQSARKGK